MSVLKKEYHSYIYILGLLGLAVSLTLSLYVMSIAQFVLLANWLLEGNLAYKLRSFFRNKPVLVFTGLYFLHLAGLFCTYDISSALDELRIKLPLLALPLIISTSTPLTNRTLNVVFLFHIAGTLISGLISFYLFHTRNITDIRDIFIFISHIRYSLNVCVDIFILLYFIFYKNSFKVWMKFVFAAIVIWLVYFLFFMESFTGIAIVLLTSVAMAVLFVIKKASQAYKILFFTVLIVSFAGASLYLHSVYKDLATSVPIDTSKLEQYTSHGNRYLHVKENKQKDNGNYTWLYVCDKELEEAWNKRSKIRYDSIDGKNSPVRFTIIRYLTSKGVKKDFEGLNSISSEEISYIEKGIANVNDIKKGNFKNRLRILYWEFESYIISNDPRGGTMTQRLELWKESLALYKNHFWLGIGTGDVKNVFAAKLVVDNSLLRGSGLRPHNQYLTFMIEFGIFGFLFFMFCLFYPALKQRKMTDFLYASFFVIALLSMFTEDTLETQAGVTFFVFFSCLMLFLKKQEHPKKNTNFEINIPDK